MCAVFSSMPFKLDEAKRDDYQCNTNYLVINANMYLIRNSLT